MPAQSSGAVAARSSLRRDPEGVGLVHHDAFGVAAEGHAAEVLVGAVVSEDREVEAILLQAAPATRAGAAGIDQAADGGEVAHLEFRDRAADLYDAADDFVAGHHRVDGVVPFVARLVQVGVADAAIEDVDDDVGGQRFAALDGKWRERRKWRSAPPRIARFWWQWRLDKDCVMADMYKFLLPSPLRPRIRPLRSMPKAPDDLPKPPIDARSGLIIALSYATFLLMTQRGDPAGNRTGA